MVIDLQSGIGGFLAGVAVTAVALYRYFKSRISPDEAYEIYKKAKKTIDNYNTAMQDGTLSPEDQLALAKDAIATLEEFLKALE